MRYWIRIFNKQPLGECFEADLTDFIKESHFQTLCAQYGLSPDAISPALESMEVINGKNRVLPFFVVRYQPLPLPPLVVYHWPADDLVGQRLFRFEGNLPEAVSDHLEQAVTIFEIELQASQLQDIGLLISYELARWIGFEGDGIVYGLDGRWYRLNRHKAFIAFAC